MASPAELKKIRDLLNGNSIAATKANLGSLVIALATTPASASTPGVAKQAATVANANPDNSDAGAKINQVIASLKAAGIMA